MLDRCTAGALVVLLLTSGCASFSAAAFISTDSASREELQQRLAAKVAALRAARHAEERKKQTEAAKRFRATNGHVEKTVGMPVLCASILHCLIHQAEHAAVMMASEELLISCDAPFPMRWLLTAFLTACQAGVKRKRGHQAEGGKGAGSPKTPHLSAADFQK